MILFIIFIITNLLLFYMFYKLGEINGKLKEIKRATDWIDDYFDRLKDHLDYLYLEEEKNSEDDNGKQ